MENKLLKNAVDDISLIKNIIESTRKSFVGFSKIFILWGVLFAILSITQWVQTMNLEATKAFYNEYQFLVFVIPITFIILATIIYKNVVRKQPLVGLERHLMVLWIMLLFIQTMPTKVSVNNLNDPNMLQMVTITTNNFSIMAFALGIALVMTAVLTGLNKLKYIGFIYFVFAFIYGYLPFYNLNNTLGQLGFIMLPVTLLMTGVYLKKHNERSEISGTQLNS